MILSGSLPLRLYLLVLLGFLVTHQSNISVQYLQQSERRWRSLWLLAFHLSFLFCLLFWEMTCVQNLNVIFLHSGKRDRQGNRGLTGGLWMTYPGLSGTRRLSVARRPKLVCWSTIQFGNEVSISAGPFSCTLSTLSDLQAGIRQSNSYILFLFVLTCLKDSWHALLHKPTTAVYYLTCKRKFACQLSEGNLQQLHSCRRTCEHLFWPAASCGIFEVLRCHNGIFKCGPLQDRAGKLVMMTQQPGRKKWDSWETNEFPALFSLTNEAGKWVRTTGWSAAQLGRGTQQEGRRGRVRGAVGGISTEEETKQRIACPSRM